MSCELWVELWNRGVGGILEGVGREMWSFLDDLIPEFCFLLSFCMRLLLLRFIGGDEAEGMDMRFGP